MKFKENAIKPGMVIHCPKEEDAIALIEHLDSLGYEIGRGLRELSYKVCGADTCYYIHSYMSVSYGHMGTYMKNKTLKEAYGELVITEFSDLIEPEPRFKVGDKVKIRKGLKPNVVYGLHCYDEYMDSFKNDTLTISEVCDNFDAKTERIVGFFYYVSEDNRNSKWDEEILELAENSIDSPMSAVEVLEWLSNHYNGKIFTEVFGADYMFYELLIEKKLSPMEIVQKITAYEAAKKAPKLKEVECGWHCHIYTEDESKPDTIISIPDAPEYDLWGVTEDEALEDAKSKAKKFTAETGQIALAHVWFKCRAKEDES